MYKLILSGEAHDDLTDIQNYSYAEFGERQWKKYNDILNQAFRQLMDHPFSGHGRNDIPPPYKSFTAGQYVIIYSIEKETIYVIRVLQQRMDFTFRFQ